LVKLGDAFTRAASPKPSVPWYSTALLGIGWTRAFCAPRKIGIFKKSFNF